jgi:hypothetical protein
LLRYLKSPFFLTATAVIRKSALDAVGGYDESIQAVEDMDLTLRLLQISGMGYVNEALYCYRRGRAESVSSTRRKTCGRIIGVLEKYARLPGSQDPEVRRMLNERLAGKHALVAAYLIREGDLRGARKHLAAAARLHPSPVTWARSALAKTGSLGLPFLSRMARRMVGDELGDAEAGGGGIKFRPGSISSAESDAQTQGARPQ